MPPVSRIRQAPPELQRALHAMFVDKAFGSIEEVTEWFNGELQAQGIEMRVGKSAVGLESLRVKRAREALAASTQAMQMIAETSPDVADMRGEVLLAQLSTGMFESILDYQEAAAEEDPVERIKLFTKASLGAARLSAAGVNQRRYRDEVETKAKAAAETVTKIARTGGLKPEQVREIRSQILGIAQRAAQPQPAVTATP